MNAIDELIPTRKSLLSRLKNWSDEEGWKLFFDTYWRLIYRTALRSGLNDAEAQDVVQETIISVWKKMPEFEYDRNGSFKSWLLNLTDWRVKDQVRKRQKRMPQRNGDRETSTKTEMIHQVADPGRIPSEAAWDEEWEQNLVEAAIERVKRKVDARHYQIFDLCVMKHWSVSRISKSLKVNRGRIYLAKHRVGKLIEKELTRLRERPLEQIRPNV